VKLGLNYIIAQLYIEGDITINLIEKSNFLREQHMPKFYSFPHNEVNVKDESWRIPLIVEQLVLHRPIFLSFAERGPIGIPVYGDHTELSTRFGAGTFDIFSKYYRHPNLFLERCLRYNKAFFVRLASETAAMATLLLQCSVYEKPLIQYQKDADGFRLVDVNGDFIPVDDGTGNPLKEPGIVLKWTTRPIDLVNEDPKHLVQSNTIMPDPDGGPDLSVTTYPVAAFVASSPGNWGNVTGFKLFWSADSDAGVASNMESIIYTLGIVNTPWGSDTVQTVRNKYLYVDSEFTFKEDTIDKATMRRYNINEVIRNEWKEEDITFSLYSYAANVTTICERCLAIENTTIFTELTSAHMVNIMTGKTLEQIYYDHIKVDTDSTDSVMLDKNIILYMTGGDDGDTSDADLESLTRDWLTGNVFPDISDQAHYPVTHLYDSGYEAETKESLINFLGIRDDVKIIMSTQSVYEEPNTKAEDQSMGSYLRSRALLHPESYIYGTQACRVTILQQCGKLNELTPYNRLVPATLDCMMKKGQWQGSIYMKGKPKGLPKSAVTVLKDINWFPVTPDFKQLSWDNALNYMQYYDMTSVHYPDVISIYPYLTSLLSDDIFTDMLVYIKHIVHFQWAKFAGIDDPIPQLIANIKDSVGKDIYAKLGNFLRAEVNPYQTELDVELGYSLTVEIPVYGTVPNRVWNVIIPVRREIVA